MATLAQLSAALVKADAAGNAADAKVLADAIRQMRGSSPDMYASGNVKKITGGPGVAPAPRPDLMGSTATTISGLVNGLYGVGPILQNTSDAIMGVGSQLTGGDYGETVEGLRNRRAELAQQNPIADVAGNIAGNMAMFGGAAAKLGTEAVGLSGKLLPSMFNGGLANQGAYTADQLARGNGGMEAIGNGIPALAGAGGALVGKGIEKAGSGIASALTSAAQRRATDAAVRGAPDVVDLKAAASSLFETAKATGSGVKSPAFNQMAFNLVQKAKGADIDPDLDGEAWTVFQRMVRMAQEAEETGGISFGRLHNLRQMAQDVAVSATKDRTKRFGREIVDGLDDLMENIKPVDGFVPPNRLGSSASPNAAGNALLEGIGLWSKAKKLSIIEEAITKAGYQKSGLENGLRLQFQAILRDARKRRLFTKEELREIEAVANGTFTGNIMTMLGKFGLGGNRILGPTIGASLFGVPGMLAATGARNLSETMGMKGAQRAANVVGSRVPIPTVPQRPNMLRIPAQFADLLTRSAGT